jgi:hypothetical protein
MKIAPNIVVKHFDELAAGDLFIYDFEGGASAGIKIVDPQHSGDLGALLLGPQFPGEQTTPHMIANLDKSVVSFGKEFTITLPIAPAFWAINETPSSTASMVIDGSNSIYFRIPQEGQGDSLIDVSTGKVTNGPASDVFAFPKSWKIVIAMDSGETHVLVQQN